MNPQSQEVKSSLRHRVAGMAQNTLAYIKNSYYRATLDLGAITKSSFSPYFVADILVYAHP